MAVILSKEALLLRGEEGERLFRDFTVITYLSRVNEYSSNNEAFVYTIIRLNNTDQRHSIAELPETISA